MDIISLLADYVRGLLDAEDQSKDQFIQDLGQFPRLEQTVSDLSRKMAADFLSLVLSNADELLRSSGRRKAMYNAQRQKTEEKIGKYDLNDFFLYYTLRYGYEPARSAAYALRAYPGLSTAEVREAAKNFFNRFFSQQFKRSCLPDGPKVGSVTLSPRGDWRMPSDASAALWLKEL
ncbi:MAG: hypothetical protein K6B44_08420 [Lachnospiraceae bacterium]|nr:hypothetical protein [Lachnospiraceae bacterium]